MRREPWGGLYEACVSGTDGAGNIGDFVCTFLTIFDPAGGFEIGGLQDIIDADPDSDLASKAEDATSKMETAVEELTKSPPDNQAALGNIEGAVGELEVALELNPGNLTLVAAMDALVGIARQVAASAVDEAVAQMIDADVLSDAQDALAEGDDLRDDGAFKDAVNKYKDALSKAESEL